MIEYSLVPSNKIKTESSPVQLINEIDVPNKTNISRIHKIDKEAKQYLANDKNPELSLKLYNFISKLYRNNIEILNNNTNNKQNPNIVNPNETKNNMDNIQSVIAELPVKLKKKATAIAKQLLNKPELKLNSLGIVKNSNTGEHMYMGTLLRTIISKSGDIDSFYNNIQAETPDKKKYRTRQSLKGNGLLPRTNKNKKKDCDISFKNKKWLKY